MTHDQFQVPLYEDRWSTGRLNSRVMASSIEHSNLWV